MKKILVTRQKGGWGDQICCEPALRAVRARFPNSHITFANDDPWFPFFFDQVRSKHSDLGPDDVIWPDPWEEGLALSEYDMHFELDGPEMRHQLDTNYNLTQSRIESWCNYVDYIPKNMCPRWYSTENERQQVIAWLDDVGIEPFGYIIIQWSAAENKKNYPYMQGVTEELARQGLPVVVCHNETIPKMDVFEVAGMPLRYVGCFVQLAAAAVGPDSFMQHLAAAVNTPSMGLFGPTNPQLYLKHYPLSRYLWHTDTSGMDCSKTTPCYGIRARNYWCNTRSNNNSWCLEQMSVESIVDAVLDYYIKLREKEFYIKKAAHLAGEKGRLFYFRDPKVNLTSLSRITSCRPLGKQIREPRSVERKICSI